MSCHHPLRHMRRSLSVTRSVECSLLSCVDAKNAKCEREKNHNSIESNTQFNLACKFKSLEFLMWHRRTSYRHTSLHIRALFASTSFALCVCMPVHAMRFICLKSLKSIANARICSSGSDFCSSSSSRQSRSMSFQSRTAATHETPACLT